MRRSPDSGAIRFAEKMLVLLDEGSFTATYKYAVLLGLLDVVMESSDRHGHPPEFVTTPQLAEKVVELYWSHTVPFSGATAAVLRQNAGRGGSQAEIVRLIGDFRSRMAVRHATGSLVQLRQRAAVEFERLVAHVEWKLVQMPLPRLQMVGATHDPFIYEINWDRNITRGEIAAYQLQGRSSFDNRIMLRPDVGTYLVQLNGVLRPLIHRHWASMVARLNGLEEARLERFLFGSDREALNRVRPHLTEIQRNMCFYCRSRLSRPGDVDHFIPWSRYPENGLANLVIAHPACNRAKRDFLPATTHVGNWVKRLESTDLVDLQEKLKWDAAVDAMRGVARAIYLRLPEDALLWQVEKTFVHPDTLQLKGLLS